MELMLTKISMLMAGLLLVPLAIVLVPSTFKRTRQDLQLLRQWVSIQRDTSGENEAMTRREISRFGQQGAETRHRRRRRAIRKYVGQRLRLAAMQTAACMATLIGLAILLVGVPMLAIPPLTRALTALGCAVVALASVGISAWIGLGRLRRRVPAKA